MSPSLPSSAACVCREPTLADPIVKAVMRADAVDQQEIETLFGRLRRDDALRRLASRYRQTMDCSRLC